MKRPLVFAFSLLALAALSACTATPGTEAGASQPSAGTTVTEDGRPLTPLAQFWKDSWWGGNLSPEELSKRQLEKATKRSDRIAECMKADGFEFSPALTPPESGGTDVTTDIEGVSDADREDREWVTSYGYGVVENPQRSMDKPYGYHNFKKRAEDNAEYLANPEPNEVYRDSLSRAQRDAYDRALSGCEGEAYTAAGGEHPQLMPEHIPLFEAITEFEEMSWPGIPELEASWGACMADKGHPGFTAQEDAMLSIKNEHEALWSVNPAAEEAQFKRMNEGEFTEPTPPAMDALTALAEKERELALTDFECREEVDYWDTQYAIQVAQEEQFIADHQEAFDALQAAYLQWDNQ